MRHVSRIHRVALDWLCDRINLDSKIRIRYIDTKHQLADILTKGNFTRDEWNNFLQFFNISHFSSACCAKNSSLISCTKTMAKRMQEQREEERIAIQKSWILIATGKPDPTQRRVLKRDCKMHTLAVWWTQHRGNLSQQKRSQGMWTSPNLKRGVFMKKKWRGDRLLIKQVRGNPMHPVNQTAREAQKLK